LATSLTSLQGRHGGVADLHRQIAARHHDAVGGVEDLAQQRHRLGALDLGDDVRPDSVLLAGNGGQAPRHLDVGAVLHEAHRHVVGAAGHCGLDVAHVLGGQGRRRQAAALLVDALVVGQLATHAHQRVDLGAGHALDVEHDQPIVEQQHIAGLHVARQVLVVQPDALGAAELGAGVQHEAGAITQLGLAALEAADADLRALQVGHKAPPPVEM